MFLFCEAKEYANNVVNVERDERSMKFRVWLFFFFLAFQLCKDLGLEEWEGGLR